MHSGNQPPRKAHMHSFKPPRRVGRWAPLTAAILGSAAIAAPAGAAGGGGAAVPTYQVGYNTASVLVTTDTGVGVGDAVTVTRGGTTLALGTVGGDPALGELGVNASHLAGDTGCWDTSGFVPQILPGDVVDVAGQAVNIPAFTAEKPVVEGNSVVVRGTTGGIDPALLDVQLWPANAGRFGTIGGGSRQFIDTARPQGFSGTMAVDPAGNFVARFSSLGADFDMAATSAAIVEYDPAALALVDANPTILVDYETSAPGAALGCSEPYRPNEATGVSRAMISQPNLGTDLTVNGVGQPLAVATGVTLTDSTGRTISAPAIGGATWTANVPAGQLAGLSDGPIKIGSTFAFGNGGTVKGLLSKDTLAPAAPTLSVAAGQYTSAQNVTLKASEGTIHYTTDGSDPTASSATYSKAINVASSKTIKAVTIDAAGNVSDVASSAYSIVAPAPAPAPQPVVAPIKAPKLKLDALTLGSRYKLKTVRKRGFSMVVFAPEGAKFVRVRLLRDGKLITRVIRKVSSDGVITVTLPTTKTGRRHLKRGTYKVQVAPGASASKFGTTTTRTVRIR
jgi:hypothetical protein